MKARVGALAALVTLAVGAGRSHAAEICGDGLDNDTNGVTDEGCNPYAVTGVCEGPLDCDFVSVAPTTGALVVTLPPDLAPDVPYGPPLTFHRTYQSRYEPASGAHGYRKSMGRWRHNFMSWVDVSSGTNSAVVHTVTGQDVRFIKSGAPTGGFQYYTGQVGSRFDYLRQSTTDSSLELRTLSGAVYKYASNGRLTEIRDALTTPNVVALAYDGNGYLSTVTDASTKRRLVFTYTSNLLTRVAYQAQPSLTQATYVDYTYSGTQLIGVSFAGTSAFTHTYAGGYLTAITDAASKTVLEAAYAVGAPGQAVRVVTAEAALGMEYISPATACYGETLQLTERANTTACDSDADCGSGLRCGGETDPASANTGICFHAATCLVGLSSIEDVTQTVTPLTPCDGACAEVAEYRWDLGTGGSKLNLIGVMSAEGHWTSYAHNADGLVTVMSEGDTDANPLNAGSGPQTWITYGNGSFPGRATEVRKLSRLKPGGSCSDTDATDCARTLLTWNGSGLLTSREERGFTHDGTGAVVAFTATEARTYDTKGRLTEIDGPLSGTVDRTTLTYYTGTSTDPRFEHLQTLALARSATAFLTTTFSDYDAWGNPQQIAHPAGHLDCVDFDNNRGWRLSHRRPMNGQTSCTTTHASDLTTTYARDASGRLTTKTLPLGNCELRTYDGFGRLDQRKSRDDCNGASAGPTEDYTYDVDGNATQVDRLDDGGTVRHRRTWSYLDSGRLGKIDNVASSGDFTELGYLEDGTLGSVTREAGIGETVYERDAFGRITSIKRYLDATTFETTTQTYPSGTSAPRPEAVTDAEGNVVRNVRDDLDRLVEVEAASGERTHYVWNVANRVIERYDGTLAMGSYTYDAAGRLLTVNLRQESCGSGSAAEETTYVYDAPPGACPISGGCNFLSGRLAYVKTRLLCDSTRADKSLDQETHYSYDAAGRLVKDHVVDDTGRTATLTYQWDKNGNLTQTIYPSSTKSSFAYGSAVSNGDRDRLVGVARLNDPDPPVVLSSGGEWLPFGPLRQYDQANSIGGSNIRATITRNLTGRVTEVKHMAGSFGRLELDITENAQGRQTVRDFTAGGTSLQDQYLSWDWQGRLRCDAAASGACPTSGTNLRTNVTTLDGAGNRTAFSHQHPSYGVQSATVVYGAGEQIDSITIGSDVVDVGYDARGDRSYDDGSASADDRRDYTYDGDHRLRTVSGKYYSGGAWRSYVATSAYDHLGRRVFRSYRNTTNGVESHTFYYYDLRDRLIEIVRTPNILTPTTYNVYSYYWMERRPLAVSMQAYAGGTPTTSRYFMHSDDAGEVLEMSSWPASGSSSVHWATNPDAFGWDQVFTGTSIFQPFVGRGMMREEGTAAWGTTTVLARPPLLWGARRVFDPMADRVHGAVQTYDGLGGGVLASQYPPCNGDPTCGGECASWDMVCGVSETSAGDMSDWGLVGWGPGSWDPGPPECDVLFCGPYDGGGGGDDADHEEWLEWFNTLNNRDQEIFSNADNVQCFYRTRTRSGKKSKRLVCSTCSFEEREIRGIDRDVNCRIADATQGERI